MFLATELNFLKVFFKIVLFLCNLLQSFGQNSVAFLIYQSLAQCSDLKAQGWLTCSTLIALGDICRDEKQLDASLIFYQKAVEMSWFYKLKKVVNHL